MYLASKEKLISDLLVRDHNNTISSRQVSVPFHVATRLLHLYPLQFLDYLQEDAQLGK